MRLKYFASSALLVVLLISCKKDEAKQTETAEPKVVEKQNFTVEVDASASAKDDFAVYYTEDGTINFNAEKAIWSAIKGDNTVQKVIFNLPEAAVPTQIRLDFGMNADQGDIVIHNVKMEFYGNSFSFKGSEFFKYFVQNELFKTKIDEAAGTMTIIRGEGKYITPFFNPSLELNNAVKNITIGQN